MLGLTAATSATDAAINKKILGSRNHATLIISNNDMEDLLKIVKSLEHSDILLNRVTETLRYKPIIKRNLDLLVSIVVIIYLIK